MTQRILNKRLIDENAVPTERMIVTTIGARSARLWRQIREFLKMHYDFQPELHFYGQKYGWCYRYRRKGKTLCVLFPEVKAFTVLVTLGKKEIEQFKQISPAFNENTQEVFSQAHQYHDGKWIYKRVLNKSDLEDVKSLIRIKKRLKTEALQRSSIQRIRGGHNEKKEGFRK